MQARNHDSWLANNISKCPTTTIVVVALRVISRPNTPVNETTQSVQEVTKLSSKLTTNLVGKSTAKPNVIDILCPKAIPADDNWAINENLVTLKQKLMVVMATDQQKLSRSPPNQSPFVCALLRTTSFSHIRSSANWTATESVGRLCVGLQVYTSTSRNKPDYYRNTNLRASIRLHKLADVRIYQKLSSSHRSWSWKLW